MQIEFERSGGFTTMRVRAIIDSGKLPSEQAKELDSLVSATSFFELPAKVTTPPVGADRFSYKITIESGGKKHTVETNDEAAPASLQPLLRRLTVLARSGGHPQR